MKNFDEELVLGCFKFCGEEFSWEITSCSQRVRLCEPQPHNAWKNQQSAKKRSLSRKTEWNRMFQRWLQKGSLQLTQLKWKHAHCLANTAISHKKMTRGSIEIPYARHPWRNTEMPIEENSFDTYIETLARFRPGLMLSQRINESWRGFRCYKRIESSIAYVTNRDVLLKRIHWAYSSGA